MTVKRNREGLPWFRREEMQVVPVAREGWALTLGYVALVLLGAVVFAQQRDPSIRLIVGWAILIFGSAAVFAVATWRIAETGETNGLNVPKKQIGDGDWFAPKRFGIGAGAPVAWQGWAVLGGYIVLIALDGFALLPRHWTLWAIVIVLLTLGLTVIAAQHTRGGWRWRWDGKDKQ